DGETWTQIQIPVTGPVVPTNDTTNPNYAVAGNKTPAGTSFGKANYDLSLAVDPNNPSVVYLGGTNEFQGSGMIRVDATGLADAHAFYLGGANTGGGTLQNATTGPASMSNPNANPLPIPTPYQLNHTLGYGILNMLVDPAQPFAVNSTILVTNAKSFSNSGAGATWTPFDQALKPATFEPLNPLNPDWWAVPTRDVQQIVTEVDPLTGQSRLVIGDGNGVFTAVAAGDGTLIGSVGNTPGGQATTSGDVTVTSGSRNGNLQIAQMYGGTSQSSYLAAQVGQLQGMFYGATNGEGVTASNPNVVNAGQAGYGDLSGAHTLAPNPGQANEGRGTAVGIGSQQNFTLSNGQPTVQGDSNLYTYQVPESLNDQQTATTDFFQLNNVSRTLGLIQNSNGGDISDAADWPYTQGFNFAVNPLNGNQVLLGSNSGRIFRTETQGKSWSIIGDPASFNNSRSTALAFGAPDPNGPVGIGNLDDYLLSGTQDGNLYITQTGGGGGANNAWTDTTPHPTAADPTAGLTLGTKQPEYGGLDGSPVVAIDPSPVRGSHAAYAVTAGGATGSYFGDPFPVGVNEPPVPITSGQTSTWSLTVPRDIYVQHLSVTVNITYPEEDLSIALVAPDGTVFPLLNQGDIKETDPPTSGSLQNVTFDDRAPMTIAQANQAGLAPPFVGPYAPRAWLSNRYNLATDY
ncbi:MAG: hypothetical protein JOZ27_06180, partial [Caulobacteraceae bacterium]|nr:hypothetical protein [Caulobacteraceae bacterium]